MIWILNLSYLFKNDWLMDDEIDINQAFQSFDSRDSICI
jgi:hypothetical protein